MELWSDAIEKSRITNGNVRIMLVLMLMIEVLYARAEGQTLSLRIFLSGKARDQIYKISLTRVDD